MPDHDEAAGSTWGPVVGVAVFGVALVVGAATWPSLMYTTGLSAHLPFKGSEDNALPLHPFAELLKLIVAALVGIVVTTVHRRYHRDKPLTRSLMQAQVLLCVAGRNGYGDHRKFGGAGVWRGGRGGYRALSDAGGRSEGLDDPVPSGRPGDGVRRGTAGGCRTRHSVPVFGSGGTGSIRRGKVASDDFVGGGLRQ